MRQRNQTRTNESSGDKFISKLVDHNVDDPVDQFEADSIIDDVDLQDSNFIDDEVPANNYMKSSLTMNDTLHSRIIDALAEISQVLDEELGDRIPDNTQPPPSPIISQTISDKLNPPSEEGYSNMEKWFLVTMGLFVMVLILIILNILIYYRARLFQSCIISHEIERQTECDAMQHRNSAIQTHVFHHPFFERRETIAIQ